MQTVLCTLRNILTSTAAILAVGGALGTNARYWLGYWLDEASWRAHSDWLSTFPVGTFVINVSGSFVLGLVAVLFRERMPDNHHWFLLLGVGFCGGYTTFSTFEWETFKLLRDELYWIAAANVLGSVSVGFLGVVLGAALGDWIFRNT
jgi:fluoride exporter